MHEPDNSSLKYRRPDKVIHLRSILIIVFHAYVDLERSFWIVFCTNFHLGCPMLATCAAHLILNCFAIIIFGENKNYKNFPNMEQNSLQHPSLKHRLHVLLFKS
jgi:hypothetical protein